MLLKNIFFYGDGFNHSTFLSILSISNKRDRSDLLWTKESKCAKLAGLAYPICSAVDKGVTYFLEIGQMILSEFGRVIPIEPNNALS